MRDTVSATSGKILVIASGYSRDFDQQRNPQDLCSILVTIVWAPDREESQDSG